MEIVNIEGSNLYPNNKIIDLIKKSIWLNHPIYFEQNKEIALYELSSKSFHEIHALLYKGSEALGNHKRMNAIWLHPTRDLVKEHLNKL